MSKFSFAFLVSGMGCDFSFSFAEQKRMDVLISSDKDIAAIFISIGKDISL